MARKRFHGLKKVKIRASWNKYNLYNLSRLRTPHFSSQTFYQQKWSAKSMTRAYHGEQIREKQWQRMFTSKLNAVIPMDHRYLAEFDGSELAAGRGSGVEKKPDQGEESQLPPLTVPYMNMTYAPVERRLDMAIFRALFASSARQARQLVVHGKVKVNGQKMPYPGYLLNPGDMFQVDVESVLFATGLPKDIAQRREGRKVHRALRNRNVSMEKFKAAGLEKKAAAKAEKESLDREARKKKPVLQDSIDERKMLRDDIQALIEKVDNYLNKTPNGRKLDAKNKQRARMFKRKARDTMRQAFRISVTELDQKRADLVVEWRAATLTPKVKGSPYTKKRLSEQYEARLEEKRAYLLKQPDSKVSKTTEKKLEKEVERFRKALSAARRNPVDYSKPYATPWQPRPFMSAFAFIPRYLEVHHAICSAVYLRHPVARPGLAEVPSPFPVEAQQLAFNWYLRRR